jgi:Protein of unknown function (DUF4238)
MDLSHYFRQMDWEIFHASPKTSFITTDNPVVLVPPSDHTLVYGVGIITKGARKIFPLSQTACLVMCDHGSFLAHRDAVSQLIRGINLVVTSHSDRFVIGCDKALVSNMVDTTKLTEWEQKHWRGYLGISRLWF